MRHNFPIGLLSGTLIACGPGDLSGDWQGEIECDDTTVEVQFELDPRGDGFQGTGTLEWVCTDFDGTWDDCLQQFLATADRPDRAGELDF